MDYSNFVLFDDDQHNLDVCEQSLGVLGVRVSQAHGLTWNRMVHGLQQYVGK